MRQVASAEALAGLGLQGDLHALRESIRQILLIEQETLDQLNLPPGIVKENVTTQGISLISLAFGQTVQIGKALLEITRPCTPCSRLEEIRLGLSESIRGRRGMLARVVQGGTIRVGDTIQLC